ncbi:MAG: ABC transporter permease [Rhizobiales bacterium]|nr:ABC transporter permease [Hyphomicrobiales bacterium]OJY04813.1 MAG: spermidine/putrescine ABC transporter permease [Rhizobiales bacterium 63-22]
MMRMLKIFYIVVFILFCVTPIAVIALISVTASNFLTFPPQGYSLRWFAQIFTDKDWFEALKNSFQIALISSALAVLIALPISYAAWRYGIRYAKFLAAVGILPFMLPPVLIALGFLLLFTFIGAYGLFVNGIIAHAVFLLALPLVMISLGFESIEQSLLEAGSTMGATNFQLFRTIILPLVFPYIIASLAFCVVISLNEYIVLLMTIGFSYETLPIKVFNAMRYGYSPILASIAVFFLLISTVVFGLIATFGNLPRILGAIDRD